MEVILCSSQCIMSGGMNINWPHYWFVQLAKVVFVKVIHSRVTIFPFISINSSRDYDSVSYLIFISLVFMYW